MRDENRVKEYLQKHCKEGQELNPCVIDEIHKLHYGKEPNNIGMLRHSNAQLYDNIFESIIKDVPYDQYELLDEESKKVWDDGKLFF